MPAVNFIATPETCSGEAAGARSCRPVSRPPSRAAKVRRAGAAALSPRLVPGSLGTWAGGLRRSGSSSGPAERGFLAASPGELAPRRRRGGDAADPQLKGAPRSGLDPPPLFHILWPPLIPKYSPSPSRGALLEAQ